MKAVVVEYSVISLTQTPRFGRGKDIFYCLIIIRINQVKGFVHPKMKILSVFTHPHVVPNIYVFICSAEHKGRYLEECFNQT